MHTVLLKAQATFLNSAIKYLHICILYLHIYQSVFIPWTGYIKFATMFVTLKRNVASWVDLAMSVCLYIRKLGSQFSRYRSHREVTYLSEEPTSNNYSIYLAVIQTNVFVWKTFLFDKVSLRNLAKIIIQNIATISKFFVLIWQL